MATRQQLEDALVKAHEAGDTESAKLFADEIKLFDTAAKPSPKAEFDKMGPLDKGITALGDTARIMGSSVGLGFTEKALAGVQSMLGQGEYEDLLAQERKETADARERAGGAGVAAGIVAPVGVGHKLSQAGLTLMNSAQGLPFIQRLLGTASAGAIEGGAYGALDALGHDEDVGSGAGLGAAFGGGLGAASELAGSVANRIGNRQLGHNTAPTVEDLNAESARLRGSINNGGDLQISGDAIADLNDTLRRNVGEGNTQGARADRHKTTMSELRRLREYSPSTQDPTTRMTRTRTGADGNSASTVSRNGNPPRTNVLDFNRSSDVERISETRNMMPDRGMTLYDLDQHRQGIRENTAVPDKADRRFGSMMIDELDRFARGLDDTTAISSTGRDVRETVDILEDARALDHRSIKMGEVGGIVKEARDAASASGGVDTGTQVRQRIGHMINDDLAMRGYSEEERRLMQEIVDGTKKSDRWRSVSRFASGTGGMAIGSGIGAGVGALGGGIGGGMAGAMVGPGASKLLGSYAGSRATAETHRQASELIDTIARGGPKAPRQTTQMVTPANQEAVRRALLILGLEDQNAQQRQKATQR